MAKPAETASAGMEKGELRKLLKFARREPVHMAFALGGDGKAVLQMDKRKQPRVLERMLKESEDTRNHRFGTVSVNPEFPQLARFTVNKSSAGMARRLVIALKGTGFRYVEIGLEDGSEVESAQGEEEDAELFGGHGEDEDDDEEEEERDAEERPRVGRSQEPDAGHAPDTPDADTPDADTPDAATSGPAPPASQTPAQQSANPNDPLNTPQVNWPDPLKTPQPDQAPPDAAALTRTLTSLVKRMLAVIAADPSQKVALAELATDAQVSLKHGDLDKAAAGIDVLREALDPAPDAQQAGAEDAPNARPPGDAPGETPGNASGPGRGDDAPASAAPPSGAAVQRYHKSRTAWIATRLKVDAEIRKLNAEVVGANDADEFGDDLETKFSAAVAPVLEILDESLADALEQAARAGSAAESEDYIRQARATIDRYIQFVSSNKVIADLDNNPFVPLAIGKTLNATLSTLSSMIR